MDYQLDGIDRQIIRALQTNAKMPYLEIAKIVGISGAGIHQRIKKLEGNGVIVGSKIIVDSNMLGYKTFAFAGVFIDKGSLYRNIVENLHQIPEVLECYYTTGQYSAFIKVACHDNEHLMTILNEKVQKIEGVARTESYICLEQSIERNLPI